MPCARMLTRQRSRTDSTLSATGQDSTETLKNNCMAFFVLLRRFDADIQPAPTNRNPIAPTASAANASGLLQTTLSKLPRPPDLHIPAFCFGAVPIGTYRLSIVIRRTTDNFRLAVIQPERTGERGPLKLYQRVSGTLSGRQPPARFASRVGERSAIINEQRDQSLPPFYPSFDR